MQQSDQNLIKRQFYQLSNLPNVLGAVDDTLIPIIAPARDEHLYFCHKGYHALNIQGVMGADGRFLNIVARWPGASHDTLTLRNSSIAEMVDDGRVTG